MKTLIFLTFLHGIIYGVVVVCAGLLIRNYFEVCISMLMRRPLPEGLLQDDSYHKAMRLIKLIGTLIIITGGIMIVNSIITWSTSHSVMSSSQIKFNF